MKRVSQIREALQDVDGALRDDPDFGWRSIGPERVLWMPDEPTDLHFASVDEASVNCIERESKSADDLIPIVELPPEIEADQSTPLLGESDKAEVRARLSALGVDALAWYMPFHQSTFQWGCYLSVKGISYLADCLLSLPLSPSRRMQLAVHALLRHEMTHFAVEYMASQWELSVGAACYWRARSALKDAELGYDPDGEKLANAYMLRGFKHPADVVRVARALDQIRKFARDQPPGYSDGEFFTDSDRFAGLMSTVGHSYVQHFPPQTYKPRFGGLDFSVHYPHQTLFESRYVPIFLVSDTSLVKLSSLILRLIPRVDGVRETESFRKKLAKMDPNIPEAWNRTKTKLARSTNIASLDFKPWRKDEDRDVFSVRVTSSVRAHLRLNRQANFWMAEAIGQHATMGHG